MLSKKCPLILLLLPLLLTGCVSLKLSPQTAHFTKQSWQQRRAQLEKINTWNINGAFSLQKNNKANIANYFWQQRASHYQIRIQSSLNLYSLIIKGQPNYVTLWESDQKPQSAASPEALMEHRLGWSLPVSLLQYWIRGLPAPGTFNSQQDTYGHLTTLTQQGWQITWADYINVGTYDLPRRLTITGHQLKIKIVIKNWAL